MSDKSDNSTILLDALEPAGCDDCQAHELEEVTLPEFTYSGSALEPFIVKNATVYLCQHCDLIRYRRSESAVWEFRKALELSRQGYLESPEEFKFIRQVLGLSMSKLSELLGVDKSTISRMEHGKVSIVASGKALCLLFSNLVTQSLISHYRDTNDPAAMHALSEIYSHERIALPQLVVAQALQVGV